MSLRIGIARDNFIDLPQTSTGWQPDEDSYYAAVAAAGFQAVQGGDGALCHRHGLTLLGIGVIRTVAESLPFAKHWSHQGALAATCIAGTGFETDAEADALVTVIHECSARYNLPIYIETHRASLTQDLWRTQQLLQRNPQLELNLDYSHWFTGLELPAHDWTVVQQQLTPVLDRTRFLHGRVSDRCSMQVALHGNEARDHLQPFVEVWSRVLQQHARQRPAEDLWFVTELLGPRYRYARIFHGNEEADRWRDALLLRDTITSLAAAASNSPQQQTAAAP